MVYFLWFLCSSLKSSQDFEAFLALCNALFLRGFHGKFKLRPQVKSNFWFQVRIVKCVQKFTNAVQINTQYFDLPVFAYLAQRLGNRIESGQIEASVQSQRVITFSWYIFVRKCAVFHIFRAIFLPVGIVKSWCFLSYLLFYCWPNNKMCRKCDLP